MKKSSIVLLLAFILFDISPSGAGEYGASFLQIGVGARALAMGGAAVAFSGDASAFYWNPAGLAGIAHPRIQLMYASQFGGFGNSLGEYQHAGMVVPIKGGANVACNWLRFAVDDIPIYPELEGRNIMQRLQNPAIRPDGTPQGFFQDNENAYFFTFSRTARFILDPGWLYLKIPLEIPFGLNFKVLQINLGKEHASGLGIDFGSMVRFSLNDLFTMRNLGQFSIAVFSQDITNTTLIWSTRHNDSIRRCWHWGIAYEQPLTRFQSHLLIGYSHTNYYSASNHLGMEWEFRKIIALRAGVDANHLATGIGLLLSFFHIDYAFESHELGFSHRISAELDFGAVKF